MRGLRSQKKNLRLALLTRSLQVRSAKRCQDVLCAYRQMLYGMEGNVFFLFSNALWNGRYELMYIFHP